MTFKEHLKYIKSENGTTGFLEYQNIKSESEAIAWHLKFTPWFSKEINVLLGKDEWLRIEEAHKSKEYVQNIEEVKKEDDAEFDEIKEDINKIIKE